MEGTLSALGNKYSVRFSLVEKDPPAGSEALEVYLGTLESDQDEFEAAMYKAACAHVEAPSGCSVYPDSHGQEWTGSQKIDAYRVNLLAWGDFARYCAFQDKRRILMESSPHAYIALVHQPMATLKRIKTILCGKDRTFFAVLLIEATAVGVWNCGKCPVGGYQKDGTFACTGCQTSSGWAFERVFDAFCKGGHNLRWKNFSDEFKLHGKPRSFSNKWQCFICSYANDVGRDTCTACGHGL